VTDKNSTTRIFISACEASADLHCAGLIETLNRQMPDSIEWVGLGGEKMAHAGCELLENPVQRAAMIYNAFAQVGHYIKLLRRIKKYLKENPVDLVIVCDSPAFNFHIARAAKKARTKVLFYVAPQLWAWAPWRIRKLRKLCGKLACILPFEQEWFTKRNVNAVFVGNPLFDGMDIDVTKISKNYDDFDPQTATVALMPGSRDAEIQTLFPAMQEIAMNIRDKWPTVKFLVSAADEKKLSTLEDLRLDDFECEYITGNLPQTARRADLALVASGSATLQVAAAGCPMVIMYQSNPLLWHLIGRWLIKSRYLSLVNILAGREAAAEFMPYFTSTKPIYEKCVGLLSNKTRLIRTSRQLVDLIVPLAQGNAAEKVASITLEMLESQSQ